MENLTTTTENTKSMTAYVIPKSVFAKVMFNITQAYFDSPGKIYDTIKDKGSFGEKSTDIFKTLLVDPFVDGLKPIAEGAKNAKDYINSAPENKKLHAKIPYVPVVTEIRGALANIAKGIVQYTFHDAGASGINDYARIQRMYNGAAKIMSNLVDKALGQNKGVEK